MFQALGYFWGGRNPLIWNLNRFPPPKLTYCTVNYYMNEGEIDRKIDNKIHEFYLNAYCAKKVSLIFSKLISFFLLTLPYSCFQGSLKSNTNQKVMPTKNNILLYPWKLSHFFSSSSSHNFSILRILLIFIEKRRNLCNKFWSK